MDRLQFRRKSKCYHWRKQTLTGLTSGLHNLTIYANDTFGNMGASNINFTIAKPFPTAIVADVSGAIAVVTIAGLLVYYKKRKR